MKLSALLKALGKERAAGEPDPDVSGIAQDSRAVEPGDLFVAVRGASADGHRFIPEAIKKGAVAVVGELTAPQGAFGPLRTPETGVSLGQVPYVTVPDSRHALAHLAAAFHGFPARRLKVIGVTGTDGKTTTSTFIWAVLEAAGHKAGMISTVSAVIGRRHLDTGLHTTTPEAQEVQAYLAEMVHAGCEYAVIETTSHALDQGRTEACDYDLAVVTNITHEHLDYHGTFEAYREAKAQLFRYLFEGHRKPDIPKVSVLNADDPSYEFLRAIPADLQLSYGAQRAAAFRAEQVELAAKGVAFTAKTPRGPIQVKLALPGRYNVYNALAALAVGLSQGLPTEAIQRGLASVQSITGRMEPVEAGQDFQVFIDFAHTPAALEEALKLCRTMAHGRVIVVFGCAGLRDRGKRPLMGESAGRLADVVVITAEDPRTEDLDDIMAQISVGCERAGRQEGRDYWRVGDRGEAIDFAIHEARRGDLVLITGKGHERSMCFGETELPWSDHQAAREALGRRGWKDPHSYPE